MSFIFFISLFYPSKKKTKNPTYFLIKSQLKSTQKQGYTSQVLNIWKKVANQSYLGRQKMDWLLAD